MTSRTYRRFSTAVILIIAPLALLGFATGIASTHTLTTCVIGLAAAAGLLYRHGRT